MRELDFLPAAYRKSRRRRALVARSMGGLLLIAGIAVGAEILQRVQVPPHAPALVRNRRVESSPALPTQAPALADDRSATIRPSSDQ